MSMVVPAVKGTATVINREGYCSCAATPVQTAIAVASTAAANFMGFSVLQRYIERVEYELKSVS